MRPLLKSRRKLLALPWPDEVPILAATDVDAYMESLGRNRKHLWQLLSETFDQRTEKGSLCYDQFCRVLYRVIRQNCDPADRQLICFSAVPSSAGYQPTCKFYSDFEVAAWWNCALEEVGYVIE